VLVSELDSERDRLGLSEEEPVLDPDPVCVWEGVGVEDGDSDGERVSLLVREGETDVDPDPVPV
jgi:hypothetical protein